MDRKLFLCFAWLIGSGFLVLSNRKPTIFLVGDSTVATFADRYAPMAGWGQEFQAFFNDNVRVNNQALAGKSSRSFIEEGKWDRVQRDIRSGDYVLIQFGHNDQKRDHRYTNPYGTYQKFLTQYIQETRQKGGIPILITSVMRRRYTKEGKLYDTHGDYPKTVRQLATKLEVPLIDLHQRSFAHFDQLGRNATKKIFLWLSPGEEKNYSSGLEDNTHFSRYGAQEVGKLVVEGIQALDLPLKNYLKGCRKESNETLTICAGDSVRIGNSYQKRAGTYRVNAGAASGCQTTRLVTLRVAAASASSRTLTVCAGERVVLGGKARTASGTYYDTYQNRLGCDSVVTTRLTVHSAPTVRRSLAICLGDSVRIGDRFRSTAGEYRHTQSTQSGCFRTVITTLEVLPVRFAEQSFSMLEGDSVWTGRQFRQQPGTYYDTLRSALGCDSVVTTTLRVVPAVPAFTEIYQSVTLCGGDSLWAGGSYQRESGTFYDTLRSSFGRDSVVVTSLRMAEPVPAPAVIADGTTLRSSALGDGYYWFLDGRTLTDTTATLPANAVGNYAVAIRVGSCISPLSEAYHHRPVVTGIPETPEAKTSFRAYRPDFRPVLVIEASWLAEASSYLYVHDILGNCVFERAVPWKTATTGTNLSRGYQQEVSFAGQPSGVYVATLLANGKRHTVRFLW